MRLGRDVSAAGGASGKKLEFDFRSATESGIRFEHVGNSENYGLA